MSYPDPNDLDSVHMDIDKYPYVDDPDNSWHDIRQTGQGVCRDYVLAFLHALLALGWPLASLRIGIVLVEPANRLPDQTHALLVVDNDKILDIRQQTICTVDDLNHIGYTPVGIQEEGGSKTFVKWSWV